MRTKDEEINTLKDQIASFVEDKTWATKRIKELEEELALKQKELIDMVKMWSLVVNHSNK